MKFLFITAGYPDASGVTSVSGIGIYVRELALGLTARGHECHVMCWTDKNAVRHEIQPEQSDSCDSVTKQSVGGIAVHVMQHNYWPLIERFSPDSRDVCNIRKFARKLDQQFGFDWIEIESDEGSGIGVLRDFPEKTVLRIHTTLGQMVLHKDVARSRTLEYRLRREQKSFDLASRIWVSTTLHRDELYQLHPYLSGLEVIALGVDVDVAADIGCFDDVPRILVIGTPDRRKGFDRLRPIMDAYASMHGPCHFAIVSRCAAEYILQTETHSRGKRPRDQLYRHS